MHSRLRYPERFKLIDALDDSQRRLLEETTRMQEVTRGQGIYQPGDPREHLFLVETGVIKIAAVGPFYGSSAIRRGIRRQARSLRHSRAAAPA